MKKISVIIPVYNDPEGLKVTLDSLLKQSLSSDLFEVIVSNDGASKEVESVCKKYNVIFTNINPRRGISYGRNRAIEKSSAELLALTDADVYCDKYWLENGIKLLKKYDYVGGVVEIDRKNLKKIFNYYEYLTAFNNKLNIKKFNYCVTANLFVKKRVIDDLGGLDEKIFYSGEDLEFGNRVYFSGKYLQGYSDEIKVVHPPREFKNLLLKQRRNRNSSIFLSEIFPERFSYLKPGLLKPFKVFLSHPFKVLTSSRKISPFYFTLVFLWSFYFGFLDMIFYLLDFFRVKNYKSWINDHL